MFCLSLEEAIRYGKYLWKLDGSETDNFNLAGSHAMGYWLRTPAARDGKMCYAVTYDGRVAPDWEPACICGGAGVRVRGYLIINEGNGLSF